MPRIIITCGNTQKREFEVADGTSLHDVMLRENPEMQNWPAPTVCVFQGAPLLRRYWHSTHLHGDAVAVFAELPMGGGGGGGGSNPVQMILQIAVVAVAALATWYVGGAGAFAAGGALAGWGGLAGGLVGAAVMMGGTLLLGQIFPTAMPSMPSGQLSSSSAEQASPTYNINGSGNAARLYQPIPEGFGRMQITPDKIADQWAEYQDNDYYLYQVFGRGRGSYDVESMAFGDVVFWRDGALVESAYVQDPTDIQVQLFEPGESVTLFPDNVEAAPGVAGQEMLAPNASGDWLGPFPSNSPGTKTSKVQLDMVLPRGLGRFNNSGALETTSVSVEFFYRQIDDLGNATTGWINCLTHTFSAATLTAVRRTFTVELPDSRFEIRGRRTTNSAASDGRTMDVVQWESMKAFLPGTLTYNQSGVAIKIKSTNAMSQNAANKFTLIQTRKLSVYDTDTGLWSSLEPVRSFAAGITHILKADYGGGRTDSQIDLAMLWGIIDPVLTQRNWRFDCWIDGPYDVWQLVLELCQPYLVLPRLSGTVVSFAFDRPNRPVMHEFTPYNIVRGTFQPTWGTYSDSSPDDVQVSYLDESAGFASRDVRAALLESEGKKPAQKNYLGVVSRDHAYQIGMAYAARNRYRRLTWEFETEGMGRILNMGDVVSLNHPRLRGTAYGQVQGWSTESLTILSRNTVNVPHDSTDLYLSLTKPDGSPWGPVKLIGWSDHSFTLDGEDFALLITQGLGSPFDWITAGESSQATVWTLQTSRQYKRRVIITSVTPTSLYGCRIVCINDADNVDEHIMEAAPPWEYRSSAGVITELPAPESLRGYIGGTSQNPTLTASWLPVLGATGYEAATSVDGEEWTPTGPVPTNTLQMDIAVGDVYVRVRALRQELFGPWAVWQGNTTMTVPAAPQPSLVKPYTAATLSLSWPAVFGDPSYIVQIFPSGALNPVRTAPLAQTTYEYTPLLGVDDGGPWRSLRADVVAVNAAGQSPAGSVSVVDNPPALISYYGTVSSTSVTLMAVTATSDVTGYVLLRGATPNFDHTTAAEIRIITTVPHIWAGLTPETLYYFRIAAKDAFFDIAGDFEELIFSDVISVTTAGEE